MIKDFIEVNSDGTLGRIYSRELSPEEEAFEASSEALREGAWRASSDDDRFALAVSGLSTAEAVVALALVEQMIVLKRRISRLEYRVADLEARQ
jgi:hypothetical protein